MSDVRRALVSVYDKTGLDAFARGLAALGIDIVSSGGTATYLEEAGVPVTRVEDVTGAPEMLGGRVKTLHPKIHGGILADRSKPDHLADLDAQGIEPIDLVVSNLYPFLSDPSVELIDIGGPAMVRAAAKNHDHVGIVTDPSDYDAVLDELRSGGELSLATRRSLARKAFAHTSAYDAAIVEWLDESIDAGVAGAGFPSTLHVVGERVDLALRYGENPHQSAALYRLAGADPWWEHMVQHEGMALSYLNIFDADAAWLLVHDLSFAWGDGPACAIIKHANPCGVAVAGDLATAYQRAFECDERSAFGGIVALNRTVDDATADKIVDAAQADVIIAPGYGDGVVERLRQKRKNTRVLEAPPPVPADRHIRPVTGGLLVQDAHHFATARADWTVVTKATPTEDQWRDAEFAWRICGWVKSNAIVLTKDGQAVGIGAGQQNRVESGLIAAQKAAGRAKGGACASDAFYPFPDGVEAAADAGVAVVIQPGGAMGDENIIATADRLGLAMVFTGERHFVH